MYECILIINTDTNEEIECLDDTPENREYADDLIQDYPHCDWQFVTR